MHSTAKITAKPHPATPAAQSLLSPGAIPAHAGKLTDPAEIKALETQAKNLIGTTFYAQMLKQMRDSPFKSELFSGGKGGDAYAGLYDQQLVERMSQRSGDKIVRPIVKKFVDKKAYEAYVKQRKEARRVAHDRRA